MTTLSVEHCSRYLPQSSQPLVGDRVGDKQNDTDPIKKGPEDIFFTVQLEKELSNKIPSNTATSYPEANIIDIGCDRNTKQPEAPELEESSDDSGTGLPGLIFRSPPNEISTTGVIKTDKVFNNTAKRKPQDIQKTPQELQLLHAMNQRMNVEVGKITTLRSYSIALEKFFQLLVDTDGQDRWENNEFCNTIKNILKLSLKITGLNLQLYNRKDFLCLLVDKNSELYQALRLYESIKNQWVYDIEGVVKEQPVLGKEQTRSFYEPGTDDNSLREQHNDLIDKVETIFESYTPLGEEYQALLDKLRGEKDESAQ